MVRDAGTQAGDHRACVADGRPASTAPATCSAPAATSRAASRADPSTGDLIWIEDCHGDTYGIWPDRRRRLRGRATRTTAATSAASRRPTRWTYHHAHRVHQGADRHARRQRRRGYSNFAGTARADAAQLVPDLATGTYTGQGQAAWTVTGNSQYVVLGGEFPNVNGVAQQGLVRFAVAVHRAEQAGPGLTPVASTRTAVLVRAGHGRDPWPANWDRDNVNLTYKLIRNGNTATPIYRPRRSSQLLEPAAMGFIDTGLTPGSTYTLPARTPTDPSATGHGQRHRHRSPSPPTAPAPYAQAVLADGASQLLAAR